MKFTRLIKWLIVILWSTSGCMTKKAQKIDMLKVKDTQINQAIKIVIKEESEYSKIENSIVIIRAEQLETGYEIRIGSIYKENLNSFLSGKVDKLLGYFESEKVPVLVYGVDEISLFEKSGQATILPIPKSKPRVKVKEGEIPPPPVIYEPVVWIYSFEHGNLELKEKGRFTLLK